MKTNFHGVTRLACIAATTSLLAACATMDAAGPKASAALESRSGSGY